MLKRGSPACRKGKKSVIFKNGPKKKKKSESRGAPRWRAFGPIKGEGIGGEE